MRINFKNSSLFLVWLWLMVFALIPNAMVFVASLLERGEDSFVVFSFTLENYARLADPIYFRILWHSLEIAFFTTLLCLLFGYPFAYLLARTDARWRPLLLLLVIIPFWTSSLIRTYAMVIIMKTHGLLNTFLLTLGFIDRPLFLLYTETAVYIGLVYALLPFMVLPLFAALEKLDPRFFEAARDLGAGRWRTFVRITLPLTLPGIVAGCMLVFLPALGMFFIPDILGGAKNMLLGNLIRDQFLSARDWPFGSAVSVVLNGLMVVLLWLYYLSSKRSEKSLSDSL